jgi:Carboxypeptidase regulatory-like domain/TonB dependent receptor
VRLVARLRVKCARTALFAALIVSATAISANAQTLYGSIVGNVRDTSGAAVPGSTVTITAKDTALERTTVTNETGSYSFANVLQGAYNVKVSLQGFKEFVQTDVPVVIGQISRVDVSLELGALTETITVASESQLLQTDKAEVSTKLKSADITNMPLNQFRNYQALINLVPGATPAGFQNAETDTPARSLSTNVNGQNRNANATRSDGATNVNIWLPHHVMYVAPAETIDTVNISTNDFDAEQGMAGGAAITVITKSGTNNFKGSGFYFNNNEKLNASPYYFGGLRADGKPPKGPLDRHIYGGTVGGPIKKNKLFFFGSYEGYKQSSTVNQFFNVPDGALKNGNFGGAVNPDGTVQIIYDPLTGNPDGSGRTPFLNNVIPEGRINPIAKQLLALYPTANSAGSGAGGFQQNYFRTEDRTTDRKNYDFKMNYNRSSAHQIWGKYALLDAVVDDRTYMLGPPTGVEGDGGITKVTQGTAGQTWTFGSNMVWDATFGFSRQKQDVLGPDFASGNFGLDTLKIPGTNDQSDIGGVADDRYAGFPRFEIGCASGNPTCAGGFSDLGNFEGWMPIFRDERTYSFNTNVTRVFGRHDVRAGFMMNFLYLNHWQPELDNPRGRFLAARNATATRGGQAGNFYNQYAAFLLGVNSEVNKSVQYEEMTTREWQHGLFIRDRWNVNDKLTLDLGLRWEYYPIMTRADRGLERVDLQTLEVLLGGRGGNPNNVGLKADWDNFAPRLGAVYRLNEDTVIRSGYGVTYNPIPWGRPLRGFYPATIAARFFTSDQFGFYNTLSDGIPLITGPDLESGRFPLPAGVDMRTPEVGNVDRGSIQSWNATIERRLPLDIAVDVAYVGTAGNGGYADVDANAPTTLGGGDLSRPYAFVDSDPITPGVQGRRRDLKLWGGRLKTRYHALQVGVNRPFTKGLLLKGAYTLSRSKNMADDDGWVGLTWNSASQIDRNYALAGFDRTHNVQMGFVYQLPLRGSGSYDGIVKAIAADWQLSGVFAAFSGRPFTVTANGAVVDMPGNQQTADLVGDVRKVGEIGASGTYLDPSAWAQPTGVRFGNTGRNQFRGPGGVNLDMGIFRGFPLGGSRRMEVRLQAANVTNTPKFGQPNTDVTSGSFMRITGAASGETFGSYGERQIQLGVRFEF